MSRIVEIAKKAIRALEDADGELDSYGHSHRHHVRLEIRGSVEELKTLTKEIEDALKKGSDSN